MSVTVVYYLSEAGQRAAALAGVRPASTQVLQLEATPELVALATPTAAGGLLLGIGGVVRLRDARRDDVTAYYEGGPIHSTVDLGLVAFAGTRSLNYGNPVPPPALDALLTSADEVIAAVEADRAHVAATLAARAAKVAADQAEAARREAAQREEALAKQREALPGVHAELVALVAEADRLDLKIDPDWRVMVAEMPEPGTRDAERLIDASWAPSGRRALAKQVGAARKAAEIRAWVAEHGSERLRGAIELGLEATRLYEDERLAIERPGWVFARDLPDFPEEEPRNPTTEAIALLRRARAVEPSARLVWTDGWWGAYVAGGADFLGHEVWLDAYVRRDGTEGALPDLRAPDNDND